MTIFNVFTEKQIEKKRLSKTANAIGGAFILGFAISAIVQIALVIVLSSRKKTALLMDDGIQWILQIVLSTVMFTLPFILMTKPMNVRVSAVCPLSKPKKGTFWPVVLCGIGLCMMANILGSMAESIFHYIGISTGSGSLPVGSSGGFYIPLVSLIAGAVLPALVEEFALRGITLGALRRFGDRFAIVASAVMFGLMHGNLQQIPFTFAVGLYLGFAVIRTGSMWAGIVIHMVNNAASFGISIIADSISQKAYTMVNCVWFFSAVFLGFLGLLFAKKDEEIFRLPPEKESSLTFSEKLGATFFTPCMILFMLYVVFEIVLLQIQSVLTV